MRIEHIAFNVADPVAMAQWYKAHLGMSTLRKTSAPLYMHFLADASGETIIEIYNNPKAPVPDYRTMHPLVVHIAFVVEDIQATRERLLKAGASAEDDITVTDAGDELAMLRDPWGFAVQLVKRRVPMKPASK